MTNNKEFWKNWIEETSKDIDEDDYLKRSLFEVTKLAYDNDQYESPQDELTDVKRVVKFRLNMSKESVKKTFGIDVWSIYGTGRFVVMEGLVLSRSTRARSGYDNKGRKAFFDVSFLPQEVIDSHEWGLAVPALGDCLFVPKKCNLTRWLTRRYQIEYFELTKVV